MRAVLSLLISLVLAAAGFPVSAPGPTCDRENRLTSIGSSWTAAYRADGLRAYKDVGGTKTYFLYDQGEPVIEMNSSGSVIAFNAFGPDGLVGRKVGSTWTYYTFDPQGNVAERWDENGNVLDHSAYDAYGSESCTATPADPWGYNARWGYYADRETGLYLCQHRYYDPAAGRWVTRDPIGYAGEVNVYGYCGGGPIGGQDHRGLSFADKAGAPLALAEIDGDVAAGNALDHLLGAGESELIDLVPAAPLLMPQGEPEGESGRRRSGEPIEAPRKRDKCQQLYRVVGSSEDYDLSHSGGYLRPWDRAAEGKYFWQSEADAREYMRIPHNGTYPVAIWTWQNPRGLGWPISWPGLDGIRGDRAWFVPRYQIPKLGPGLRLPTHERN